MGAAKQSPPTLEELLLKALSLTEALETRCLLIGGLAVGIVGEARVTQDVDLILALPIRKLNMLTRQAREAGFAMANTSLEEAKATGAMRLRWRGLDRRYLEHWAQKLSDEAEDSPIWQTLHRLLRAAEEPA